jgi:hypothetical protein
MKTKEVIILDEHSLKNAKIEDNIQKLIVKWGNTIPDKVKFFYSREIDCFLHKVTIQCPHLLILDVSALDGEQFNHNINVTNLREIYFPKSIECVSFQRSVSLKKISALGAKTIRITKCPNLETLELGDELEEICLSETGITEIRLPPHIKLIDRAFHFCKNLRSVILSDGTDIPARTFEGCINLKEVTLPNDLLVLEPFVFSGCIKLRSICGGLSIKQFFPSAIKDCYDLEKIDSMSFYKYSNLNFTDENWEKKYRPKYYLYTLEKKLSQIKEFVCSLSEHSVDFPEQYIAENFLPFKEKQYGVLISPQWEAKRWIIWSLNQQKFIVSKKTNMSNYSIGTIIMYDNTKIPVVEIDNRINIYWEELCIDLSKVLIINQNEDDLYNDVIEFFNPKESILQYYSKITKTIEGLDITAIIDSYFIKEERGWNIRPGKDDHEWFDRVAKSSYSDAYLNKLLPQEKYHNDSYAVRPCDYNPEMDNKQLQMAANAEAMEIKEDARNSYSVVEHVCTLLQEFIDKRNELEKNVESKYHLKTAMDFIEYYFIPFRDELEEEKTIRILCNYSIDDILLSR